MAALGRREEKKMSLIGMIYFDQKPCRPCPTEMISMPPKKCIQHKKKKLIPATDKILFILLLRILKIKDLLNNDSCI